MIFSLCGTELASLALAAGNTVFSGGEFDEPGIEDPSPLDDKEELYIPRTKFLFAGLANYVEHDGDSTKPQKYNNTNRDYEPIEGAGYAGQYDRAGG